MIEDEFIIMIMKIIRDGYNEEICYYGEKHVVLVRSKGEMVRAKNTHSLTHTNSTYACENFHSQLLCYYLLSKEMHSQGGVRTQQLLNISCCTNESVSTSNAATDPSHSLSEIGAHHRYGCGGTTRVLSCDNTCQTMQHFGKLILLLPNSHF